MAALPDEDPLNIPSASDVTDDSLLGGRVHLLQPEDGYRAAIDPVFLAAAVPVRAGESVLDVGAGTGAASLCLAMREPDCRISGLDVEPTTVRLANENVRRNGVANRVNIMIGDVTRPPIRLAPGTFDHAMANPPYLEAEKATPPANGGRATAHVEGTADLATWIRFALAMVRAKGTFTLIHRADRLDHVLAELHGRAGGIVVFPLWPDSSAKPAKRVLVRAVKGSAQPMRLAAGLVLHETGGRYTAAAEAVLRHAHPLEL
ncbi:MAG TPA: methyltransferase [Alphaproteobacteria bacterium]|jgi:tRNA1(Val) A37 N6-methylase TrmN6|nr:methyltransferase [Alphaproteobacteria bacterium]